MTGKKQNMAPMWKKLMKNVILTKPTSFNDHVFLGCTQRECKPNETVIEQYTKMFESRISAGATEKYWDGKNLTHKPQRGSAAWKDMLQHWLMDAVDWHPRATVQSFSCLFGRLHFKKKELESVGELSKVCSQIVLKCLYFARIGRPDLSVVRKHTSTSNS